MPKIIISYRRADSDAITGRIRDRLAKHYGDNSIFMDIDSVPLGTDFRKHIKDALLQNEILIAVIGPKWVGATGAGDARIKNESDPVRIEVETALQRGIPTIPVLVNGAGMPRQDELPDSLKDFCFYNAAEVETGRDFHSHMDRLIRSIDLILKGKADPGSSWKRFLPRRKWAIGLAAATIGLLALGWMFLPPPSLQTETADRSAQARVPTRPQEEAVRYAVAADAALACEPNSLALFYDDFASPNPAWIGLGKQPSGSNVYHADRQLIIKPEPGGFRVIDHPSLAFKNATICARVTSATQAKRMNDADYGYAGVVFWSSDPVSSGAKSFYVLVIKADGSYGINRFVDNSRYTISALRPFKAIRSGPGVVNEIKLKNQGHINTVLFNGEKAEDFNAQPPKDAKYGGLVGATAPDQQTEWRFLDIVIVSANYASELTDFGVAPQKELRRGDQIGTPTPTTVPVGRTIKTRDLYDAMQDNVLDGSPFLLVDVLGDAHDKTLPGAKRIPYGGDEGNFEDDIQRRLSRDLRLATKNNLNMPLVFFCEGAKCWESYNAVLRASKMGFTRIYWYRGGIFAWEHAGLPMK
jgi:PQQ-dependent catabolism-associated CXXCW motif protein